MKKRKIFILGGGYASAIGQVHRDAIRLLGNWEVIGGIFSGRNNEVNKSAKMWGIERDFVFPEYKSIPKKLLASVDLVCILTPTPSHKEQILYFLKTGKNIISEKSLCLSSKDATNILKVQNSVQREVFTTYNYIGYPMLREIKHMLDKKKLGKIIHIEINMRQNSYLSNKKLNNKIQSWRSIDYELPTVYLDLGVHIFSIMHYLIGKKIEKTIGLSNHSGDFSDVIDEVHAIGSLSDSTSFRVSFGKAFLGSSNGLNIKIYGKNASIFWNQEYPNEFLLNTNSKKKLFIDRSYSGLQVANQKRYQVFKPGHPEGFLEAFTNIYRDFDIYFNTGEKNRTNEINLFSTFNSINILETLEAIWKSNKTKKWEKVGKILKTDY